MGYSNDIDFVDIEEQVKLLAKSCDLFSQMHSFVTQTEIGGMMHNILLGIRRLENSISHIVSRQEMTLLDMVNFKIDFVRRQIGYINSDLKLSQSFDVDKKDEEDTTDWDAMLDLENEEVPFTIGDNYDAYNKTRYFLMSSIRRNYYETEDRIKSIISKLGELEILKTRIERSEETQREIYMNMMEDYRNTEWRQDRDSYILQVNTSIKKDSAKGISLIETLNKELSALVMTHLNSFMPTPLRNLYNTVVNHRHHPFEVIIRHKKKLKEDDITTYFSFLFRYSTLKEHIDSIMLEEPLIGQYEKLFTSQAAKEYVDLLIPAIWAYGGIENKEHFAILLLVMMELGLAKANTNPYLPMANYANEINVDDEELRFKEGKNKQSMITKVAGMFSDIQFCKLEFGETGAIELSVDKMKEYQMVYWRCFTILNQRGLRMPKEIKVASYLKNSHPSINLSVIMEGFPNEQLIRLNFLRSVLRRETHVFG